MASEPTLAEGGLGRAFAAVLKRDLVVALRNRGETLQPVLFYVLVLALFPLAVSPQAAALEPLAAGVIWVAALLATMLSLERIFRADFEDGTLEQMLMSAYPLVILVQAKVLAHWLLTGLPLMIASPFLAELMALPSGALPTLLATLALGTPVLSEVGAIGVALTVGLPRGGAFLSLLVLPLYIPVLVFGASAVRASADGLAVLGNLYLLGAFALLAISLAPIATAAALRVGIE